MRNTCTEPDCEGVAFGRGLCSRHYQRASYHGILPTEPPVRICKQCGKSFATRKWNARYCSRPCNERAHWERTRKVHYSDPVLNCEQCGAAFGKKRIDARFCSPDCGQDWHNAKRAAEVRAQKINTRPPCRGCGGPIPHIRRGRAIYCSDDCKIRARRHEAYGLTKAELELLLAQHEVCAICETDDWGKKGPQVDHDHVTGRVRGVLCNNCNNGLGRFADDPMRLKRAIEYLSTM